jgi:predicted glycosyltransferase involved in capsule biosynthesis
MEADSEQRYRVKKASRQIEYHFVMDKNPIFQHTLYLNYLYNLVKTPIIAGCDTDALVPPEQIIETVEQIEQRKAVMGLPYNGYMLLTNPSDIERYEITRNLKSLIENEENMPSMYGSLSVGGTFIVDREKYLQSGGENEYFLGWGPEDFERVKRIEILFSQQSVYRVAGCLFHLWHPRLLNSWYANVEYEKRGKQEYLKVCGMSTMELENM